MKYKKVLVTSRGGTDAVQFVENELREPVEGEVRIRILASPVCQDDIAIRVGNRPFLAKIPFTPGYSFIGVVDSVGPGVSGIENGDQVAALTNYGSHAEVIYWKAESLVHVPDKLDPSESVILLLNYLVAYQCLHRVAQVKAGDKVLIIGASGGVGTAFLQLGKLAELKMYGLASPAKHPLLEEYGAAPIDYHRQDVVEHIRQAKPEGLDFVFNGMGEEYFEPGLQVLRRGGMLVHYGAPQSFRHFLLLVVKLIGYNLLPNGKTIKGYGTHREGVDTMKEDWLTLFDLLDQGKIRPIIEREFSFMDVVKAYELLESGTVTGNLVIRMSEPQQGNVR
jgi:NADPH:quinone reductase-like Zn-dependent oxidoreductase